MRLEKTLLSRIETLAGRAGNAAFRQKKHDLIAECLRLQGAGGNVERYLAHEELSALSSHFGQEPALNCRTAQGKGSK
ncbi:MAG: hypothetical protein C3F19_09435 [Rhodocyclales bacterium]|nr:MAG: hypothetical protein C3F19_09435 [Rhodocyclales bacterium]